jgi:hypothetical protein
MKKILFALLLCLLATSAYAETRSFQLSLVPDVAIHARDTYIKGVTIGIWSENPQAAFALGFVNGSKGDSTGFSLGLVNYAENYIGADLGTVNLASGTFKGMQWGFLNYAGKLSGLQLGVVNVAKSADSAIQIGLVNVIQQNEWFSEFPQALAKGMVFLNWRF